MIKFDELMKEAIKGDALSQYGVGLFYLNGFEVEQNMEEAVSWFMKSAEQGLDEAQINLAYAYMTGEGIDFNPEKGFSWYMKAALQGNAEAQRTVGACYGDGNGVKQDDKKAFTWYMKAAEQGNSDAQYNIGHCYYKGDGVKQDLRKAFTWFEKAAEQGSHEAQYYVGVFYLDGKGVSCDMDKAIYWLSKSAEGGIEPATQLLQQIEAYDVEDGASDEYEKESFETPQNNLQTIISDENIFTVEEAMACFCVGSAIVKHANQPLIPPGIFMFSNNEEFLIYKDLMMYAVYLLGIKSESDWSQIFADAEDSNRLAYALKLVSQLPGKKKTCASIFLRIIAGSNADEDNFGERVFRYHNYCVECGLREFIDTGIAQKLSMKMTLYNGYDYMRENYAEYIDVDELEDTYEDDEEFDPEYEFKEEYDEEDSDEEEYLDEEESEETDAYDLIQNGDEQFEKGEFVLSKFYYQTAMIQEPLYGYYCYYRIGWIEGLSGNYDSALEYYNKGIALNNAFSYLHLMKGSLLKKHFGNEEEAIKCYRRCIEIEEGKIEEGICSHHAYAELGMRDQAIEVMNRYLEMYSSEAGLYFDAACMYCTLKDYDLALDFLGTALSKGYNIQHVLFDPEIDALRGFEKYKKILDYCQDLPFDDAPYSDMSVK